MAVNTCPHAKSITGLAHTRGCSLRETKSVTPKTVSTYLMPCIEVCYNGDYTKCPVYKQEATS